MVRLDKFRETDWDKIRDSFRVRKFLPWNGATPCAVLVPVSQQGISYMFC